MSRREAQKEGTIRTEDRERLGAKVSFHLAGRRSLAFNYVYGSVYESGEGSGRRKGLVEGVRGIPRRARRARTITLDAMCRASESARPAVCP